MVSESSRGYPEPFLQSIIQERDDLYPRETL